MTDIVIRPAEDLSSVQAFIRNHWTLHHPTGRADSPMAAFYFQTPWVNRNSFPHGLSVLQAWLNSVCVGVSCALVTPDVAWHVIWTVSQDARGFGTGRRLLLAMRDAVAPRPFHVCGISALGRPQYEATGFQTGMALRWRLTSDPPVSVCKPRALDPEWFAYRFDQHPVFKYERRGETILRHDHNAWGHVVHVARIGADWPIALHPLRSSASLIQAWALTSPGMGWEVPPAWLPSVFHPIEARGNTLGVAGWPALPAEIHGADGMQDRPT